MKLLPHTIRLLSFATIYFKRAVQRYFNFPVLPWRSRHLLKFQPCLYNLHTKIYPLENYSSYSTSELLPFITSVTFLSTIYTQKSDPSVPHSFKPSHQRYVLIIRDLNPVISWNFNPVRTSYLHTTIYRLKNIRHSHYWTVLFLLIMLDLLETLNDMTLRAAVDFLRLSTDQNFAKLDSSTVQKNEDYSNALH